MLSFPSTFGPDEAHLLGSVVRGAGGDVESAVVLVVIPDDRQFHALSVAEIDSRIIIAADPLGRLSRQYAGHDQLLGRRWTSLLIDPDRMIRFELVHEGPRGVRELLELIKTTNAVTR